MTLENCIKCPNHMSYQSGYVICGYWSQPQQQVTFNSANGDVIVVGCALDSAKQKRIKAG